MKAKEKTQIQVRIDLKTKRDAKKILDEIGMDASTAVNILFKQIVRTGTLPIDLRDVNGFSPAKAKELEESIKSAEASKKTLKNAKSLMDDILVR
ncbi:hypothetical protein MNBD_BACTEROID05-1011 [hydrothermal vent metagenome]|uniref:DNA-damage-inducible protein J n=1 Tax=hydrothermal vent metagenome TaxID=652676 RepID=A0A3B0THS9_9ZZZZ